MTEPTQPASSPVAVPWTPPQNTAAPTAPSNPVPAQTAVPNQPTPAPMQPAFQPPQAPQPQPQAAGVPQPYPQQAAPQTQHTHYVAPQPNAPQPGPMAAQQPQQAMAYHAPGGQMPGQPQQPYQPQQQPMRQIQGQMPSPQHQPVHQTPPPPLAPHMRQAIAPQAAEIKESKSLVGKLLKRSPKPVQEAPLSGNLPAPTAPSGSWLNKSFVLGIVAGTILGAFALPMLIDIISGGETPKVAEYQTESQAFAESQALPGLDPNAPADSEGDTFLDNAIASEGR